MSNFKLSEPQLEQILFNGATKHLKENLRKRLLEQVTKEVDEVIESTFKQLALNLKSYTQYDVAMGETKILYNINIDGVDKIKGEV